MTRSMALEVCTLLAAAAGLLACAWLGGWLGPASAVGAGLIALAPLVRGRLGRLPWAAITGVVALAGLLVPLLLGGTLIDALGASLLGLQVVRRFARSGPGDDRASAVLALLMIVLASTLDPAPLVGLAAVAWIGAVAPLGVLTFLARVGHRRSRESPIVRSHLGSLSVLVVLGAALLFVALPRLRGADLGRDDASAGRIGFADEVTIGDVGELLDDTTAVLRLTAPTGAPEPRYLRGIVLDRFDGRTWSATVPDAVAPAEPPPGATRVDVVQDALAGGVAFAPGRIAAITNTSAPFVPDAAGTWRLQGSPRRITYTAWTVDRQVDPSPAGRWIALPDDLDPRIGALAGELVSAEDDAATAARAIEAWLLQNATYTYAPRDAQAENPLETFLFERRTGHCEYFATAEAVLLRASGHPSRVVNGYARPEYSGIGGYWLARQGNAHSWVEYRDLEGVWHRIDPTPGGSRPPEGTAWSQVTDAVDTWWTGRVLAYDGAAQVALVRSAGWWVQSRVTGSTPGDAVPWLGLILVLAVIGGAGWIALSVLRRLGRRLAGERPPRPRGALARIHHRARLAVAREGLEVPAALPPVEAARWLGDRLPDAGATLEELAWLHYEVRYGNAEEAPRLGPARERLARLRRQLREGATKRGSAEVADRR